MAIDKIGFINEIGPIIREEAIRRGYKFPSAIIAQACLESRYGDSGLAKYHNYFGLKCGSSWTGPSVNMKTKEEYTPGVLTSISDNFRVYSDMRSGVSGYFDFISKKRYANLKDATSSRNYLELIKQDGYATSSAYVTNVYSVVTNYGLEKFDISDNAQIMSANTQGSYYNPGMYQMEKQEVKKSGFVPAIIFGYVNQKYVENGVTISDLNLRTGPTTAHGIVAVIQKGSKVFLP